MCQNKLRGRPGVVGILQPTPASKIHSPRSSFHNETLEVFELFRSKIVIREAATFEDSPVHGSKQIPAVGGEEILSYFLPLISPWIIGISVSPSLNLQ